MKTVRCAIYTRKSSEEGLEQAFNSLDAQREACAAYILSQASERWTALPDIYDDGGLSGGTLERPALQRLLAEVKAARIDIIVVYKVDRLTRSLLDFSKLVEAFDAAGTSFVSVTQSFNTTTSMGRLTLNMLLSFAQFEREVTAERIRDKIAASKAKGMWMGGTPPLGYKPDGRSLAIVEEEASLVRRIFIRYLELGNVRLLADELAEQGIWAPKRIRMKSGQAFGGVPFTRGQIYSLLKCPTYVGEIHHKGEVHAALHQPIIDRDTWDRVQAELADNRQGHRSGARSANPSLFAGKIVDGAGQPLIAVHATKRVLSNVEGGAHRYRYYVSRDLHESKATTGMRLPAREVELAVTARLANFVADPVALIAASWLEVRPDQMAALAATCRGISISTTAEARPTVRRLVEQVRVTDAGIDISIGTAALAEMLGVATIEGAPSQLLLHTAVRLTRTGKAMRLIQGDGRGVAATPNPSLVRLIVKAHRWWKIMRNGEVDLRTLGAQEGVAPAYITRVMRLAFLAPDLTDAMLTGRTPAELGVAALTAPGVISPCWAKQRSTLLTAAWHSDAT